MRSIISVKVPLECIKESFHWYIFQDALRDGENIAAIKFQFTQCTSLQGGEGQTQKLFYENFFEVFLFSSSTQHPTYISSLLISPRDANELRPKSDAADIGARGHSYPIYLPYDIGVHFFWEEKSINLSNQLEHRSL